MGSKDMRPGGHAGAGGRVCRAHYGLGSRRGPGVGYPSTAGPGGAGAASSFLNHTNGAIPWLLSATSAARGRALATGSPTRIAAPRAAGTRSEEHTSELQSRRDLVCRLLLEKKN